MHARTHAGVYVYVPHTFAVGCLHQCYHLIRRCKTVVRSRCRSLFQNQNLRQIRCYLTWWYDTTYSPILMPFHNKTREYYSRESVAQCKLDFLVAETVTLTFRGFKKILNPSWLNRRGKMIGGWVEVDRWLQNFCSLSCCLNYLLSRRALPHLSVSRESPFQCSNVSYNHVDSSANSRIESDCFGNSLNCHNSVTTLLVV